MRKTIALWAVVVLLLAVLLVAIFSEPADAGGFFEPIMEPTIEQPCMKANGKRCSERETERKKPEPEPEPEPETKPKLCVWEDKGVVKSGPECPEPSEGISFAKQ